MTGATPAEHALPPRGLIRGAERRLTRVLEVAVILLMALLVLVVLWGVASRYVLGNQARWSEELAIALLVWVALLASALVFRSHGHLGIDLLVEQMGPAARRIADGFGTAVTVLFAASAMIFGGGTLVLQAIENGQTLPALGVSMAWVHLSIPVSGLFIVLFGLVRAETPGRTLTGVDDDEDDAGAAADAGADPPAEEAAVG